MRTIRDEDEKGVAFEDVTVKRASPKAMLCDFGDLGEHWIPLSQVHDDSEVFVNDEQAIEGSPGKLVLKRWICEQKGLV